jgi:hypothetical protein
MIGIGPLNFFSFSVFTVTHICVKIQASHLKHNKEHTWKYNITDVRIYTYSVCRNKVKEVKCCNGS